jgi:hypothetical protein
MNTYHTALWSNSSSSDDENRYNTIQMVLVQHFNFVSMMLPVTISPLLFKQYNQMIKNDLWDGKKTE